ncbi:MAG: rod shape-determining protein MreC [Terrimonas sp.]|nr:rod shape-determining protein MreC [Terrimonas sp.]
MRNVILFIRRYSTFISFLVLQFIALSFLFRYNKYHRVTFLGMANEITGRFNTQYDKIDDYFHLREENARVHKMNDSLLNLLRSDFIIPDTSKILVRDTISYDTTGRIRKYYWREAKVVANSTVNEKNYIQISRGANQGIKDNMPVVSSEGSPVGIVANVSANFSQVMSLLHVQRTTSVMMKKSRNTGRLEWDGKNPHFLTLRRIPKSDSVAIGDTVLTSNFQQVNFPPGLIVGTVQEISTEKSTGDYILKIKPAVNFQNIQQVFVIENLFYDEQTRLDKDTRKKVEESDKKNN